MILFQNPDIILKTGNSLMHPALKMGYNPCFRNNLFTLYRVLYKKIDNLEFNKYRLFGYL